MWFFGCIVIEMFIGKLVWEDNGFDLLSWIGYLNELLFILVGVLEFGCDFLEKCLR